MQIRVQVTLVGGNQEEVHELGDFERAAMSFETLGLTLEEGKDVLHTLQTVLIEQQVSRQLEGVRPCPECSVPRRVKGHLHIPANAAPNGSSTVSVQPGSLTLLPS